MSKMGQELEDRLDANKYEMWEALKELVEFDELGGNGKDHYVLIHRAKEVLVKVEGGK